MNPKDARERVAAALAGIPYTKVAAWPHAVDQPAGPTAVIVVTGVKPADVACPHLRTELDVWLFTGMTTDQAAYDALDLLLADVLDALDANGIRWTDATSGVWRDTHPAYRIAVEEYA